MRKLAYILFLLTALTASGAQSQEQQPANEPLRLKDGTYLFISDDDTMRMTNKDGKPIEMKDSVEMELEDGTLIMMKNKKIWRHYHRDMK